MTARDVAEVLGRLRAAGIDFWVEGGWGVDALLGEQTRPHDDLDLGVRMQDVERICAVMPEFERDDVDWPQAFVLRDRQGRKLDCHPLVFDENGDAWQAKRDGGTPYLWAREALQGRGTIDGVEVPCVTPEFQVQWRNYPEFDDVDWNDVRLLCERFALEVPPECRKRPGFIAAKRRTS